jgi:hypothetical protein
MTKKQIGSAAFLVETLSHGTPEFGGIKDDG